MKRVLEEIGGFFWGYLNLFLEDSSIYVYITSALASIVYTWNNYSADIARNFTILLVLSIISIIITGFKMEDAHVDMMFEESETTGKKRAKSSAILLDMILVGLVIVGCIVELELALCITFFMCSLQVIIWLADELDTYAQYYRKRSYKIISGVVEVIELVLPVAITIVLGVLWWRLNIGTTVKAVVFTAYILAIPFITILADEISLTIPEIVSFKE